MDAPRMLRGLLQEFGPFPPQPLVVRKKLEGDLHKNRSSVCHMASVGRRWRRDSPSLFLQSKCLEAPLTTLRYALFGQYKALALRKGLDLLSCISTGRNLGCLAGPSAIWNILVALPSSTSSFPGVELESSFSSSTAPSASATSSLGANSPNIPWIVSIGD